MSIARTAVRQAKDALLRTAKLGGAHGLLSRSEWRRRRLLILCYHGLSLSDEHLWSNLYITQDHLRHRFSLLRDGSYTVLPLAEALTRLASGDLPERSVAITFDDGAYDFFVKAYPLLQEFAYHTTLYLSTYYCSTQYPVFDTVVSYLLWKGVDRTIQLGERPGIRIPRGGAGRQELHAEILAFTKQKQLSAKDKNELVAELCENVGVDFAELNRRRLLHLMNPAEVASLSSENVSVQLHTHRHRTPRDRGLFLKEIKDNRRAIRAMRPTGEALEHFCYPSGQYEGAFLDWLSEVGVVSATTCNPHLATSRDNRLLLPRLVDTMEISDTLFESWLAGVASFVPQQRRMRS